MNRVYFDNWTISGIAFADGTHTTQTDLSANIAVEGGKTYTITANFGRTNSGGGNSGGSDKLNTDDHYSYIIGYQDGCVRPYGTITRGEVAAIFFRLLTDEARDKYWSQTNPYSDCNSELWCNNAISTLANMGIIDGFEDSAFRPNVNITRAQACVVVNRAMGRKPDEEHLLSKRKMITWPDNVPGDWYYADIQEATNSHDYTWLSKGSDKKYTEEWTKKMEQRDWTAFEHAWSTAHSAPGGEVVK